MKLGRCLGVLGVVAGALLVVTIGVVGWVVAPKIVDNKVEDLTRLTNDETREKWEKVTMPIQMKFYIYNITNPDDFKIGKKLIFKEIGPYVYREARSKETELADDKQTITYNQRISYYFDKQASGELRDTDLFTIPNVPLISLAHIAATNDPDSRTFQTVFQLLEYFDIFYPPDEHFEVGLFKQFVPVHELLFDGWEMHKSITNIGKEGGIPDFADGRFGLYENKNNSQDGTFVIETGDEDYEKFGEILTWNGEEELAFWPTEGLSNTSDRHYCNKINGSDGSIFPPFVETDRILRVFNTDICRSLWLTYDSKDEFEDIPAYKFKIPSAVFEDPAVDENNQCFCQNQTGIVTSDCGKGYVRIFPCKSGAPIAISNPHFYDGDASRLLDPIEGISPGQEDVHQTQVFLEPKSGVLLKASKKIQINIEVQNFPPFKYFRDIDITNMTDHPSIFLPIFWAEELVQMSDQNVQDLKDKLIKPQKAINIARWTLISISGVLFLASALSLIFSR